MVKVSTVGERSLSCYATVPEEMQSPKGRWSLEAFESPIVVWVFLTLTRLALSMQSVMGGMGKQGYFPSLFQTSCRRLSHERTDEMGAACTMESVERA
jgi:hypothetical protein